ncbi:MAG: hypothetical protein CMJ20_03460 [Phycisphaeraceae bacterium]|mgnify:FL=1|nr:hypothetical protein [Phycisphaeraceae bacterium]
MTPPNHVKPQAYALLASQMPVIETPNGLLHAAVAIAMHTMENIDPNEVDRSLQDITDQIRQRLRSNEHQALLAHAHQVLFEEYGFAGNTDHYYEPQNSYIPIVLETRTGIPITLTLIYKIVLERLGLCVHGLNTPGHFLARVEVKGNPMIIDPFCRGQMRSREETFELIEKMIGQATNRSPLLMQHATHDQWIVRILNNLIHIFDKKNDDENLAAMMEMKALVLKHCTG